jgi:hypothetical protein
MTVKITAPRETQANERRVAVVPAVGAKLGKTWRRSDCAEGSR